MKKIITLLTLSFFVLIACEGTQGPPGPPGGIIVSDAFEIQVSFNPSNNYSIVEPYGFTAHPYDVTLVYIEWEDNVWRLLPQVVDFNDGSQLQYNYDFTDRDVSIFLGGNTNLNTLGPEWTQDQVFRVVIVPADNIDGVDVNQLNNVIDMANIKSFERKLIN